MGKEISRAAQAEAQGENFYPPAIEAGGAVNERSNEFPVALACSPSISPPECALFLGCALQCIRAISLKACVPSFSSIREMNITPRRRGKSPRPP